MLTLGSVLVTECLSHTGWCCPAWGFWNSQGMHHIFSSLIREPKLAPTASLVLPRIPTLFLFHSFFFSVCRLFFFFLPILLISFLSVFIFFLSLYSLSFFLSLNFCMWSFCDFIASCLISRRSNSHNHLFI